MPEPKKAAARKAAQKKQADAAAASAESAGPESRRDYLARLAQQYGWTRAIHDDCDVYRYPGVWPVQVNQIAICWTPDTDPGSPGNWRMVTLDGRRDMATNGMQSLAHMFGDAFGDPGGVHRYGLPYVCERGAKLAGEYAGMHPDQAWAKWLESERYQAWRQMSDAIAGGSDDDRT